MKISVILMLVLL